MMQDWYGAQVAIAKAAGVKAWVLNHHLVMTTRKWLIAMARDMAAELKAEIARRQELGPQ
jgi:hypothetical protein